MSLETDTVASLETVEAPAAWATFVAVLDTALADFRTTHPSDHARRIWTDEANRYLAKSGMPPFLR